ncbi:AAA family ATPase [Pseudanabaena sp. FACHB-1998]|uniref:AAA family ATPase n=1 Tax=Pseudanabaena sp. FACHB-1998 TaxID=2692858 RepID=UPI0016802A67|nr:AAA family ATPase [Pseudanabaena sp. FACHB-1998]MBD2178454.1 AAA family ATPase [Pseudanabaena sp. FACHB-1998]
MHLQRVQVPDFRVLKDVDITFEKDFNPRVFPLGSQNGGGKSTLLQLIFVLLHCSTNPRRLPALNNLLSSFMLQAGEDKKELAVIDIWDENKTIQLDFFVVSERHLKEFNKNLDVNLDDKFESLTKRIQQQQSITEGESQEAYFFANFLIDEIIKSLSLMGDTILITCYVDIDEMNFPRLLTLLCNIKNLGGYKPHEFLNCLSNKIFLAAPSTQVFLFLDEESINSLFKSNSVYQSNLKKINSILPSLFTYDFLATELLINFFKSIRDKDFKEAIKTGEYGDNYKKSLQNLNLIMNNKQVNLSEDFSSITFKIIGLDNSINLYPQDLSHGELKRLSIYVWLKYKNIEDSIVLMDEVDLALHPDWQYKITTDLVEWSPSNQYILATHSYEVCEALTPSHVKILKPKLTERRTK